MAEKIIEVTNLHKHYGAVHAVKGLDFYVEQGKTFAFLGPNGAGKSTTIDIISTFLTHDSGTITVDGYEIGKEDDQIRRLIGVVFQDGLLDDLLTVKENLKLRGGFYGLKGKGLQQAVARVAEITNINEFINRPYGKLSGGQKRRCDIARALINTPKILFLDEPTTGLDPQTRKNIWEMITALQKETGMTVFLTTHYMNEAADTDFVLVIDNGEIAAKGTPAELKEKYTHDRLILFCKNQEQTKIIEEIVRGYHTKYIKTANQITAELPSTLEAIPIIEACRAHILGFEVLNGTMDDAFIAITGKEIRE